MSCWGMMTHRGCLTTRQVRETAVGRGRGAGGVWTHWCKRAATLVHQGLRVPMLSLTVACNSRHVLSNIRHTGSPADSVCTQAEWLSNTVPCVLLLLCMAGRCEGLAYATIEPPPENPMQTIPRNLRAKSRREADYLLRYISCE